MSTATQNQLPVFGEDGAIRFYDLEHLPGILDRLFDKLRVAVIYGGDNTVAGAVKFSSLNVRSWKSYEAVAADIAKNLRKIGFKHVFLMPDDRTLYDNLEKHDIDFVWLNTGGVQGYNPTSHAPAMLEMMGVPYIGHDPLNTSLLDNKHLFKREMTALGVRTAPFFNWNKSKNGNNTYWLEELPGIFGDYSGPFVIKPVSGRASLEIHIADNMFALPRLVDDVYAKTRNNVLIERYLPGREYCVSIYGTVLYQDGKFIEKAEPFAFSEVERVLETDERIFTSMDKKALTGNRFRLLDDENDRDVKKRLSDLATQVYTYLDLTTLIRLDVRADENGELAVLETNPKPDLKEPENGVISIVTVGLEPLGMSYNDLILSILANRLHHLFSVQRGYIRHIVDMIR